MDEPVPVEESSGNVFADLGLPNPEERLLKAELGRQIRRLVLTRGLTQAATGQALGLAQPHVSDLLNGKLAGISVERLVGYLNALGQDVDIVVTPAADRTRGHTRVSTTNRDRMRQRQQQHMDELTRLGEEMGGYDPPAPDIEAAPTR